LKNRQKRRADEEEDLGSYWMTLKRKENTPIGKRKH
jgi:hypothetical protein